MRLKVEKTVRVIEIPDTGNWGDLVCYLSVVEGETAKLCHPKQYT
jgi:hypothetical protein